MNPILRDFILDLDRLRRMLELSKQFGAFPAIPLDPATIQELPVRNAVTALHTLGAEGHRDVPILNGVLLLYLAGRFENFVREIFEDLCDSLAGQFQDFTHLPKQMRENLVKFTAEVIANPRKYGHAENGVIAFVKTLSDNLNGVPVAGVNSKCLSITTENMWPDTVSEIFGRIGANKVWERIGQQASVQLFFQVDQPEKATQEAKKVLGELMELRNKIAHPSAGIIWPSTEQAMRFVNYCGTIAPVVVEICCLWNTTLGTRTVAPAAGPV
jgi:HEPN superfamily RiboL-PSP-like protein